MMLRGAVLVPAALALAACVRVTPITMPDGRQGYSISCPPAEGGTACIQKAGDLCPEGYQVEGSGATTSAGFFSNGYSSTFFAVSRPQLFVECADRGALLPTANQESERVVCHSASGNVTTERDTCTGALHGTAMGPVE